MGDQSFGPMMEKGVKNQMTAGSQEHSLRKNTAPPSDCIKIQSSTNKKEGPKLIRYYDIYKRDKNPVWLRERICKEAQTIGIKPAARKYGCSKTTVKEWLKRESKNNKKRGPATAKNKIPQKQIDRFIAAREASGGDAMSLKMEFGFPESHMTIHRHLKKAGKIIPRKTKRQRKGDLRAIKAKYRAFEKIQIDGKVLDDIPEFYGSYKDLGLPRVQFSARCVKTGAAFHAYSSGETMLAGCVFIVYLFEHLIKYGVDVTKIKIQTDNGSFAIGSMRSVKLSAFVELIQKVYKAKHRTIEVGKKTMNSDVERFHGLIEEGFYVRETFNSKREFYLKSAIYQIRFNYFRKNRYKGWKTPVKLLNEDSPHIDPTVLSLPPIDLDEHIDMYLYKVDPEYLPVTPEIFFQDAPPSEYEELVKEAYVQRGQLTMLLDKYYNLFFILNTHS